MNSIDKPLEGGPTDSIHKLPIREVYGVLATRPQGLTQAEAAERLQQFGSNVIQ